MYRMSTPFILGLFFAPIVLPPLHAQTTASIPADTNATAAKPTPTGQAPDDVMKKLSDLVHAGKYAEAQQLTAGLLLAYPEDQRLIKAKVMLDKLFVPASAAQTTPHNNPPASSGSSAQPAMNTNAEQFTGMEKVDYDALIELARQAQQSTDLGQQKTLLKQFMDQSSLFVHEHPNELLLWQLRAAAAISLNDPVAGYEAGRRLLLTGVADGTDPNLRRLLAQLKNKGWLDKEEAEKQEKNYAPVGTWSLIINDDAETEQHEHKLSQSDGRWYGEGGGPATVEISRSDSAIRIDITTEDGVKHPYHLLRATVANSGAIHWEGWTYLGWQPARSYELVDNDRTMRIVFSVVPTHKKSRSLPFANTDLQYTNTFVLHKN